MSERSSPSRTAGVCLRNVTILGETYLLSQADKVRRAADEEAVIISRRLDMLQAIGRACVALPVEERAAWREQFIEKMMSGIATPSEWNTYYNSLWRLAFRFWNALDPKHKADPSNPGRSMTLLDGVAWAYELLSSDDVTKDEIDSLWLAIRMVSQEDSIKNSSPGSEAPVTQPTATPSMGATQPSTPSS